MFYLKSLFTLIISSSLDLTSVRLDKGPLIYKTLIKDCHSAKYLDLLSNGNLAANCYSYLGDEVINIYNLSSNEPLVFTVKPQYRYSVTDMKHLKNGNFATGSWYHTVDFWDSSLRNPQNKGFIVSTLVLINLNDNLIAIGSWEHRVYIADALTGERVYELAVGIFF